MPKSLWLANCKVRMWKEECVRLDTIYIHTHTHTHTIYFHNAHRCLAVSTAANFKVQIFGTFIFFISLLQEFFFFWKIKTVTDQQQKTKAMWVKNVCTINSTTWLINAYANAGQTTGSDKVLINLKRHYRWLLHLSSATFRQKRRQNSWL